MKRMRQELSYWRVGVEEKRVFIVLDLEIFWEQVSIWMGRTFITNLGDGCLRKDVRF